jgi:LytS/YehU family sensor histidine kinase
MIARLGDFLRKTIDNNGTQEVSLQDELEFLRCYLEIEQVRFRDRLQVTYETEPAALRGKVPNLILQPIVENAIKHGIAPTMEAGRIQVRARCREDWLEVQVENDGPQTGGRGATLREGVGMGNTRERLHQLYQESFRLSLDPRPQGGAVITLRLPYRVNGGSAPEAA